MTKGKRIRTQREELRISQTELASRIDVSKQTLYKYENDIVTNIPSDVIERLSEVLQCSPAYIMGWDSPAPSSKTTTDTQELLDTYNKLNGEGKQKVREYASDLVNTGMYEKKWHYDEYGVIHYPWQIERR